MFSDGPAGRNSDIPLASAVRPLPGPNGGVRPGTFAHRASIFYYGTIIAIPYRVVKGFSSFFVEGEGLLSAKDASDKQKGARGPLLRCERAYKRTEIKVRRYKRNVLSVRQTGIRRKESHESILAFRTCNSFYHSGDR